MIVFRLAIKSLRARWLTAILTVLAIGVSVMLLLGVEKIRSGARQSFVDTISGTDLIVGARSGNIQLLLYSVFRIGNATNNITWKSYERISKRPEVAWSVPLSLGDSHKGFRVLGTSPQYFDVYRYRQGKQLTFGAGKRFSSLFEAVIGADVARKLGYKVGQKIIIGHGLGAVSFLKHDELPFVVVGILDKTGTPVDRTVHVSLRSIEAIHVNWQEGVPAQGQKFSEAEIRAMRLQPRAITAALIGLKSKLAIFRLQRAINTYRLEPMSAVLPGLALQELWSLVATAEQALAAISVMVVVTALLGMAIMILTTLNERRREMAILRSVGARPVTVVGLFVAEAIVLTSLGVGVGTGLVYGGLLLLQPWVDQVYGLYLPISGLSYEDMLTMGGVVVCGAVIGLLPAWRAYRLSVGDGMMVRI